MTQQPDPWSGEPFDAPPPPGRPGDTPPPEAGHSPAPEYYGHPGSQGQPVVPGMPAYPSASAPPASAPPTSGYSPSGYPGAGYPNPGHPSAGYPSPGHPSAGYPSPGHPGSSYPAPSYPAPGYPNLGYPAATGYPAPGYSAPGYPAPDYSAPGYPAPGYATTPAYPGAAYQTPAPSYTSGFAPQGGYPQAEVGLQPNMPSPVPPPPSDGRWQPVRIDPVAGTEFGLVQLQVPPLPSGQATGSMIAGIASILVSLLVLCFGLTGASRGWGGSVAGAFTVLGVLFGGGAIALGLIARRQIRGSGREGRIRFTGGGRALSGIICGATGAGISLLSLALALVLQLS